MGNGLAPLRRGDVKAGEAVVAPAMAATALAVAARHSGKRRGLRDEIEAPKSNAAGLHV